jgi:hypothetical protein
MLNKTSGLPDFFDATVFGSRGEAEHCADCMSRELEDDSLSYRIRPLPGPTWVVEVRGLFGDVLGVV